MLQYVVLFKYFRRFLKAAAEKGIDVAPLKGAHLLTSVYSDQEERGILADIDFLVRPEQWDEVSVLLSEMGFVRHVEVDRPATNRECYESSFYFYMSGKPRMRFEPHRYLVQPERHPIDYDALWARSIKSTFDRVPCYRLTAEDHILHSIIHLMTHSFIRPERSLRDIELLIRRGRANLDIAVSRAKEWQCARGAWLAFTLLKEYTPQLDIEDFVRGLAPNRGVRRALRFFIPNINGFRYANLGLRTREAMLFPLILDGVNPLVRFSRYYVGLRLRDWKQKKDTLLHWRSS
ncbi:MAG: nucleotidyltransferase family protein [Myxococcota bacterium]|nr:nucleotidyltransferase family protein [Myxococcota bacterium]